LVHVAIQSLVMDDLFAEELKALHTRSLDRHLREIGSAQGSEVEIAGRRLINFSSNDYLGLASDPRLRKAATAAIDEFGVGAGASRLISGTQSPHLRLESALAKWKGTEAALCFSSGYAAALGTIPALVTKNDVVLLDKLCHASLIDGAKLSGAILRVFPHNHVRKLESHLDWARREYSGKRVLIITESVFSMDGDRAPLRELVQLKKRFGAMLMLDDAHAVGVIGPNGRGLASAENLNDEVDVQMGTLSKALGASGGYICGSRTLIEWLINRARAFIYSTAPPPAIAAAALAAVDFLASPFDVKVSLPVSDVIPQYAYLFLTPHVRLKFNSTGTLQPWLLFGGGYADFSPAQPRSGGVKVSGQGSTGTLEFGGGVDTRPLIRLKNIPKIGTLPIAARVEVRDFYSGQPNYGLSTISNHQNNVTFTGGLLLRF